MVQAKFAIGELIDKVRRALDNSALFYFLELSVERRA